MVVPPTAIDRLRSETRKRRLSHSKKCIFIPASFDLTDLMVDLIGLYRPIGGEPDPAPMVSAFHHPTALPFLEQANTMMQFRRWSPGDPLVPAPWGGHQPASDAAEIIPDVIFVPLVAFDERFNRIGQGGGHYDRYLASNPLALRIGLAWDFQRIDAIEAQPWDVPLDAVLTDQKFYVKDLMRCRRL
jgi:5-formyltetrahydrofolate cyclo-ligase